MGKAPDDYEVGYGRPPRKSQFVKGKTGNPLGRPKGSKNKNVALRAALDPFNDVLGEAFARPLKVVDAAGHRREVPALQLTVEKLLVGAAGGNFKAQKLIVELAKAWGTEIRTGKSQRIGAMEAYVRHWGPIFEAAKSSGEPEPSQLPHPAHFQFLADENDATLRGPVNANDKAMWDQLKANIRHVDDAIERARTQLRTPSKTSATLERKLANLQYLLVLLEAQIPHGWDWTECVTDSDRTYYAKRNKRRA